MGLFSQTGNGSVPGIGRDYARLQKRLSQMFGMEGSENFYFATKSKSLNDGLEKQLVTFVTEQD